MADDNRQNTYKKQWERVYSITLDAETQKSLWRAMAQELQYCNSLIVQLNGKIRVLGNEIANVKDQMEKLWLATAQAGVDPSTLARKDADAWPEPLRPFRDIIAKDGKQLISDRAMMILRIAASPADIHPVVRKAIAAEVMKHVQPQAKILNQSLESSTGQMRSPLHMLQPNELTYKRHVQLVGTAVSLSYDDSQRITHVHIPYSSKSIEIRGQDITQNPHDNIIIRQLPNQPVTSATPWQIVIKEGSGKYLLDLVDASYTPVRSSKKRR